MRSFRRCAACPTCRRDVPLSRWTGRIKLHVGTTFGEAVFCKTGHFSMHGGAA